MLESKMYLHPNTFLKQNIPSYFNYWLVLHIVSFLLLGIILLFYKIEKKIVFVGYYQNNQVRVIVDESFFEIITDKLIINETLYSYEVNKVEPIAYEEGKVSLWEVMISLELPNSWKIDNHQFKISFVKERTTIFKQFIKNIKKGMKL